MAEKTEIVPALRVSEDGLAELYDPASGMAIQCRTFGIQESPIGGGMIVSVTFYIGPR